MIGKFILPFLKNLTTLKDVDSLAFACQSVYLLNDFYGRFDVTAGDAEFSANDVAGLTLVEYRMVSQAFRQT